LQVPAASRPWKSVSYPRPNFRMRVTSPVNQSEVGCRASMVQQHSRVERHAQVVKLVDTLASGASGLTAVEVRVFSWAPLQTKPSLCSALLFLPPRPASAP